MKNKYNLDIDKEVVETNIDRLTNQLWKLIPMRENNEDWESHLTNVILEIAGLNNILVDIDFFVLICKLEGLRTVETSFEVYRRNVFESISLLRRVKIGEKEQLNTSI